jgi:uncharacterized protein
MLEDKKILAILLEWNEFWKKDIKAREITKDICNSVGKEVIDLVGVRRSGKSTILALIIKELKIKEDQILYVNFEEPAFVNYYSLDLLDKILDIYRLNINSDKKPYIFLDEIQLIPEWEKWVRKIRELDSAYIFVTGSSSKLLSKEFGTALTGRHISFQIMPLSFKEYLIFKNKKLPKTNLEIIKNRIIYLKEFNKYLVEGGFPQTTLKPNKQLLKNYFEDILYKDIAVRYNIRDLNALRKLANYCITNISNPISYNSLRNLYKLSLDSIRSYMSYFEEAYLLFTVPIFSYSLKVQEQNPRKLYTIDNGLRNAVSFKFSEDEGRLAENLVFIELKRKQKEMYYWKSKGEIDFVIKNKDNSVDLINVCYANDIPIREVDSINEFKVQYSKLKINKCIILTKDTERKDKLIEYIPLWKWLLE